MVTVTQTEVGRCVRVDVYKSGSTLSQVYVKQVEMHLLARRYRIFRLLTMIVKS